MLRLTSVCSDPIGEYIDSPTLPQVDDPIKYWLGQRAAGHPLAQMALDFLSAPAASTDVERAFSRGGLTVSKRRHALSDKSVRASTVLGSWAAVPGLIPEAEVEEVLREKAKRAKKGGVVYISSDDDE